MTKLIGKGRDAVHMIADEGSFIENQTQTAPGAVVGTGTVGGRAATVISNDAKVMNKRFPTVLSGVIGLEEGYKMAMAVYDTIAADKDSAEKRPIVLIVDTPGNGPGKTEEIFGMNKATGAYQLALAEARQHGHPVLAVIIGRAISGAFLCHGLQADRIITLSKEFGTMIHVMPLSSIARITKMDIETLEELAKTNPVFASGADFFYELGGVEEIIESIDDLKPAVIKHIDEIYALRDNLENTGPWSRGTLGAKRGGRKVRADVLAKMEEEFEAVAGNYIDS
ncbi:MAG: biotin-independent malonate decarboxylase subunit gamma [Defluviitaleaceae bacterium]|nr:biotin-independent malonate decarboxylase subunit gamma [Defluviitaleaceae bacterium]